MHGDTFVKQLANGTEESKARMQSALNNAWHLALGIFEKSPYEDDLITAQIFAGEDVLKAKWQEKVTALLTSYNLQVPVTDETKIAYGGRQGYHSEYLKPLLDEMTEVVQLDPTAEW